MVLILLETTAEERSNSLTVARKAFGITGASVAMATSTRRIRLTCSPSLMSPRGTRRLWSSAVTPLTSRSSSVRLPSASAWRYVFSLTSASAVDQLTWRCRAASVNRSLRSPSPGWYSTSETDFMRSAMAMIRPETTMSMGAVEVRKEAFLMSSGVLAVRYSKE